MFYFSVGSKLKSVKYILTRTHTYLYGKVRREGNYLYTYNKKGGNNFNPTVYPS